MEHDAAGGIRRRRWIAGIALPIAALIGGGHGPAMGGDDSAKTFASLPPEAQGRINAEADDVQRKCAEDMTYRNYHDCGCLRGKFVAARLANPDKNRLNITFDIRAECVNKPGILSSNYDFCFNKASHMMPSTKNMSGTQRANYCRCSAEAMVGKYSSAPDPRHSYISNMQVDALNTCLPK